MKTKYFFLFLFSLTLSYASQAQQDTTKTTYFAKALKGYRFGFAAQLGADHLTQGLGNLNQRLTNLNFPKIYPTGMGVGFNFQMTNDKAMLIVGYRRSFWGSAAAENPNAAELSAKNFEVKGYRTLFHAGHFRSMLMLGASSANYRMTYSQQGASSFDDLMNNKANAYSVDISTRTPSYNAMGGLGLFLTNKRGSKNSFNFGIDVAYIHPVFQSKQWRQSNLGKSPVADMPLISTEVLSTRLLFSMAF